MRIYTDEDADLSRIRMARVAVVGYGNQGHAHALNLRDSGVAEVGVALRPGSARTAPARAAGFRVFSVADAAAWADVLMILTPDEEQPRLWADEIAPNLRAGATVAFAHGLAVHFGYIDLGDAPAFLVAPKGPGRLVRSKYEEGQGLPCLFAITAPPVRPLALAYASAIGCGRSAMIETTFCDECVTDLFGEQAVLCGGIPDLIRMGYETLIEAGHAPELAYFECVHEAKQIVDLIHDRGMDAMRAGISNTAEFGGYATGARLVTDRTRDEMRAVLDDIVSGRFAERLMADQAAGGAAMARFRAEASDPSLEAAGERVRALMPWIGAEPTSRSD